KKTKPTPQNTATDHTNAKHMFVDDQGNIAGGCTGLDNTGFRWTCYAGQRAVTEGIITQNLLGQHLDAPTRG
ncbi:hypothetical protein E1165_17215, partial [Micromonospora sp. KC723]